MSFSTIPRDVLMYGVSEYSPLEDLYMLSLEDPNYQSVVIDETNKRTLEGSIEPFVVASNHQDESMLRYALRNTPLQLQDILRDVGCIPWLTAQIIELTGNRDLLFQSCDPLELLTFPEILSIYLQDVVRGHYVLNGEYIFIGTVNIISHAKNFDDILRYIVSYRDLYGLYPPYVLQGLFVRWYLPPNLDESEQLGRLQNYNRQRIAIMDVLRNIEKDPSSWLNPDTKGIDVLQEFFQDPQVRDELRDIQQITSSR